MPHGDVLEYLYWRCQYGKRRFHVGCAIVAWTVRARVMKGRRLDGEFGKDEQRG